MRRMMVCLLAVLVLTACAAKPLDDPTHDTPAGDDPVTWRHVASIPPAVDPAAAAVVVDGDLIAISLPHFPPYEVVEVAVDHDLVTVVTDLPARAGERLGLHEAGNVTVIVVDGLDEIDNPQVQLATADGAVLDVVLSRSEAAARANDHAGTDLVAATWSYAEFRPVDDRLRVIYGIDFQDDQVIDRRGSNAVSGWFEVDGVTGEVLDSRVTRIPLGSTRQLAAGATFLGWTPGSLLVAAAGSDLVLYTPDGQEVERVDTGIDLRGLELAGVHGISAWLRTPDGACIRVMMDIGDASTAPNSQPWSPDDACPEFPEPPGHMAEDARHGDEGPSRVLHLTTTVGNRGVELRCVDDWGAMEWSLEVTVIDGDERRDVSVADLDYHLVLRSWAAAEPDALYFSTEIAGPRYGMWVTEYALAGLSVTQGELRRVALMPTPRFALSPCGQWAAYGWRDREERILIVELTP